MGAKYPNVMTEEDRRRRPPPSPAPPPSHIRTWVKNVYLTPEERKAMGGRIEVVTMENAGKFRVVRNGDK